MIYFQKEETSDEKQTYLKLNFNSDWVVRCNSRGLWLFAILSYPQAVYVN
jgi:hypothetical protein